MNTSRKLQSGLSLIELMVALLIGLLLLGGLIQIFSSTRTNFRVQTSLNFMQENLRVAASEVGYSLRMAGFFHTIAAPRAVVAASGSLVGTVGNIEAISEADVLTVGPSVAAVDCNVLSWTIGLQGFEGAATDPTGSCLNGYLPNTDAFAVTYLRPRFVGPAPTGVGAAPTGVLDTPVANQIYGLIFDIKDKEIGTSQGGLIGTTTDLTDAIARSALYYDSSTVAGRRGRDKNGTGVQNILKRTAAMMPLELEIYYIRACSVVGADGSCPADADGGNPQPTLVRLRRVLNVMTAEALVEGVEQMQIEYSASGCGTYLNATGIAAWTGCAGTYANDASRWQRVLNARVRLLSRSNEPDPAFNDVGPYNLSADTNAYNPSTVTQLPRNQRYRRALLAINGQPRNATRPLPAP
jgi:type IV pilus assembly protein PilW